MKLELDPQAVARRLPASWVRRYEAYVAADPPAGALDDPRAAVRLGIVVLFGLLAGLLAWAALAPLSSAVVAQGVVSVAGHRQTVQALNGGAVDRILVREGQQVRGGQPLLRLNPLDAEAAVAQDQVRRDALKAAEARLIAERDGLPEPPFAPELLARAADPNVAAVLAAERSLLQRRRRQVQAEQAAEAGAVADARAQVDGVQAQIEGDGAQAALVREQLADMLKLYRRGFAPKARVLALRSSLIGLRTDRLSARAKLRSAQAAVDSAEARRQGAEAARQAQGADQLRQVQVQLGQTEPRLKAVRRSLDATTVRAPVSGKVVGLAVFTPGAVVGAGQRLLDIAPDRRALTVEARVRPYDAAGLHAGSAARVRFSALDPRALPTVHGVVTTVSADRLTDARTGQGYFQVEIELDPDEVARRRLQLQPGLPAEVLIPTHARTALQYLLTPFTDALGRAFRER